ncbi:MAG: hypothetical protein AB7K68_10470 [Bacteriovoracia bacterium]
MLKKILNYFREPVRVAYISDDRYAMPLTVSLRSLIESKSNRFYVCRMAKAHEVGNAGSPQV